MLGRRILVVALVVAGVAPGCGSGGSSEDSILVFAAASLTGAFERVAEAFEARYDDVAVELNFGGSSSLREQILEAAPADVFASANPTDMDAVVDAGMATAPRPFASNRLQLAVAPGNPGAVDEIGDLADDGLLLGLCAEEVPCGVYARAVLRAAGVTPSIDTNEPDVRSLLTKLEAGELDAGIVYRTDVLAAGGGIVGIDIPSHLNVTAEYPIAVLDDTSDRDLAERFVDFVLAPEGRRILRRSGFSGP